MSTTSTPNDSPVHVHPLHNPSQAAHVSVPQAPLGNATNGATTATAPGLGTKALLAKRFAKTNNPTYVSPTDNLMTPCTQKITAAKKKHFTKGAKPMQPLFGQKELSSEEDEDEDEDLQTPRKPAQQADSKMDDDENPF
ncbi:hypothetical protein GLOTRDRAFT_109501 [Gloeophyllum trabeum ATCC 11539]|uniref:Uncharacterized protein n=1 Tax=Gloeophyllum trabeum (strain ATCC 11539 / FP-39264 / Madison 617) TaxID=670483 RepID=S7RZZ8_GLOTA|nr:uncharacterized protein GLOTRDRAFT_109501 [Gloeophyllum trabeum ATCC 11539]EPQ58999.1 hypothetical protein GLOTRDRAFT_109501 [Gloeophyllum trabeum ATCC 11539]